MTGAAGYLASHVIIHMLQAGFKVKGTIRCDVTDPKVAHLRALPAYGTGQLTLVHADLLSDDGWVEAIAGCTFVAHVASPAPITNPKHPDDVIKPAVEGTLRVLRAVASSSTVTRVVITSSNSAISEGHDGAYDGDVRRLQSYIFDESDWSDVTRVRGWGAYVVAKTQAEKAAWDFVNALPTSRGLQLTVLNPVFILGPVLGADVGASASLVKRLMNGSMPGLLRLSFNVVHVDDVARAHVLALTVAAAAGHRFLLCSNYRLWMSDVADVLREHFTSQGFSIPSNVLPRPLVWIASLFDPTVAMVYDHLGRLRNTCNTKSKLLLGLRYQSHTAAIVSCGQSLVDRGLVRAPKRRVVSVKGGLLAAGAVALAVLAAWAVRR